MTISVGFTTAEIREFVHEYQLLPHGTKGAWLAERGLSYDMVRRWRSTVFEGDLDRGLVHERVEPWLFHRTNAPRSRRSVRKNVPLKRLRSRS